MAGPAVGGQGSACAEGVMESQRVESGVRRGDVARCGAFDASPQVAGLCAGAGARTGRAQQVVEEEKQRARDGRHHHAHEHNLRRREVLSVTSFRVQHLLPGFLLLLRLTHGGTREHKNETYAHGICR